MIFFEKNSRIFFVDLLVSSVRNSKFFFSEILSTLSLQICISQVVAAAETCAATVNFKVVTEILSYENPRRITAPGKTCEDDLDAGCLVRFLVYLDL
jgi:hypothetical protein